jgi:hypothetical protein
MSDTDNTTAAPVAEPVRDLFAEGQELKVIEGAGQLVTTFVNVPATVLPELAKAIQASIAGLDLNRGAIIKGGTTKAGGKGVPYAVLRHLPTPVSITAWANGTVTFAGADPRTIPTVWPMVKSFLKG